MRSSSDRMKPAHDLPGPVGGRQETTTRSGQGGGYPDICTDYVGTMARGISDPRLEDLRALGIHDRWLRVARAIGVDAFIQVWRILDEGNNTSEGVRVRVPMFSSWRRRKRNMYIVALAESKSPREIRKHLLGQGWCERISERHISRIIAKAKGKAG